MKKVKKKDLEDLITDFYCKFIARIPEEKYYELACDDKAKVCIKSTHIVVWWYLDDSDMDADLNIEDFIREIEKITSGKLEVTYYGIEEGIFEVYIANRYEEIE